MNMAGVSPIGWLHTFASLVALALGAFVLTRKKGTSLHKLVGKVYAGAFLVAGFSAFAIYHFDIQFVPFKAGPGVFGLFHYETVVTLAFLFFALWTARRQRHAFSAYAHPVSMLVVYYNVVAAFINEAVVRVAPLRRIADAQIEGKAANVAQSPLARELHYVAQIGFLLLIIWFMVAVARSRGRRAQSASTIETGVPAP
jgi:uncharacterized membrane protein